MTDIISKIILGICFTIVVFLLGVDIGTRYIEITPEQCLSVCVEQFEKFGC